MVASRGPWRRARRKRTTSTRATRFGVAALLAGALLAAPFLLGGCEIVISNTVDPFMPYVIGEIDLSSVLPSTSRETKINVVMAGPDADILVFVVLVRPDSAGADVVVMLEGSAPTVRVRQDSTAITRFDTRPFRHFFGSVQIGNLVYNPLTRVLSNGPRLERDYRAITAPGENTYQLLYVADSQLFVENFDSQFTFSVEPDALPLGDVGISSVARLDTLDTRSTGFQVYDFFFFGYNGETDKGETWYFLLEYGVGDPTGVLQLQKNDLLPGTVQRTPAGFLGQDHEDKLVRIDLESGAVLDTFRPRHDGGHSSGPHEVTPIVFDPQGTFYLLLDQEKRILYKVAPWW